MEFYDGPVQTLDKLRYRVDMTYDGILNPTQEDWVMYDLDGTTPIRSVRFTHTWVDAEITKTETLIL